MSAINILAESSCRVILAKLSRSVPECSFARRVQLQQKMSGYKLFYFPGRGAGEISRLSFAAANIEFEDVRLDSEAWAKEKACRLTTESAAEFGCFLGSKCFGATYNPLTGTTEYIDLIFGE